MSKLNRLGWRRKMLLNSRGGAAGPALPLDGLSSISVAYSVRKLRTAYAGNCLKLRRSSDNAEADFGFDANGDLDAAAIAAWLGANSGFVTTWYDQSGNGRNATQTTPALQPQYIAAGINSKPMLRNNPSGNSDYLGVPSAAMTSLAAATICMVGKIHTFDGSEAFWGHFDTGSSQYGIYLWTGNSDSKARMNFGSSNATRSADTFTWTNPHIVIGAGTNGAKQHLYIDGTEVNYDTGRQYDAVTTPASFTDTPAIGQGHAGDTAHDSDLDVCECILFTAELEAAQRNSLEASQAAYWGI